MSRIYSFLITFLMLSGGLHAAGMGMGDAARQQPIPDVDKESLIFNVPNKWYPYHKDTEVKKSTYIFPTGQKPEKWKEALQFDEFKGLQGVTNPNQLYKLKTDANQARCDEYTKTESVDKRMNGYLTSQWGETCNMADNTTMSTINKVVVGNDQLYVISKIWKYEPKERHVNQWTNYMDTVYVCDPTTGSNSCRPPRPEGRQGGMGR